MKSKYYRPDDEEFYIGFEYYREEPYTGDMSLCIWSGDTTYRHYNKYSEEFYVKYLDREDIESLGFKYDNNAEPIPSRDDWNIPKTTDYELPLAFLKDTQLVNGKGWYLYLYKDNTVWIEYIKDCCGMGYLFKGIIKNKSELIKLLTQLNIKDED